jgi:2-(1,2-epoxy-1,2-dihydrophenyl)acetyl-CoA isomerase
VEKQTHETGLFSWQRDGDIAIFRVEKPVVEFANDLQAKEAVFTHFSKLEQSTEIKALLLTHSSDALSDEKYQRFILDLKHSASPGGLSDPEIILQRQEYTLVQYILLATTFRKVLVSCLRGRIASPYFGAHLASDIRIVSEDFVVEMSHIALGIPPTGGLGFFLPRYVGQGRATEILLSGEPLPAARALDLGLVHAVVPKQDIEAHCLHTVRRFLTPSARTISLTKGISCPFQKELELYLRSEMSAVIRALLAPEER